MASAPIDLTGMLSNAQPDSTPAPAQSQPVAAPAQSQPQSQPQGHGFWHGLLSAVAGGDTSTNYSVDPNTGKTVTTQTPISDGDMFRNIFRAALTGLAGGVEANRNGASGALGAIGGGFQAEEQQQQRQDLLKRQQAQQQFQDTQQSQDMQLRKAADAREQLQSGLDAARTQAAIKQIQAGTQNLNDEHNQRLLNQLKVSVDSYNALQDAGFVPVEGAPEFDSIPDAMAWANQHPDNMQTLMHGNSGTGKFITRASVNPTTGKIQLFEAPDQKRDFTFTGKDSQGNPFTWTQKMTGAEAKATYDSIAKSAQDVQVKNSEISKNLSEVRKNNADANKANAAAAGGDMPITATGMALAQGLQAGKFSVSEVRRMKDGEAAIRYVQQIDPTWTDRRYQTLRDFATGKPAKQLANLVMLGQHLDRFETNSQKQGFRVNPLSDIASRVASDANDISGVYGQLVKGGVITQDEHKYLMGRLNAHTEGIRDAAADELKELVSGKIDGLKQQFKNGTGYEMPTSMLGTASNLSGNGSPAAQYKQTATGPNGVRIGSNDGGQTWINLATGKQVQ